jgi:hypothetical protein
MIQRHMVITGNPVDGFFYYGPFEDHDHALGYAEVEHDGQDYWITPLQHVPPPGYSLLENQHGVYWETYGLEGRSPYLKSVEEAATSAWAHYEERKLFTSTLTEQEKHDIVKKMRCGGSFVSTLAEAYSRADSGNAAAIEKAFDHLFKSYSKF